MAKLILYREANGVVPLLRFMDSLKPRVLADVKAMLELLQERGHLLRPPHTEHLGQQLQYLRVNSEDGTYRIFYWPHGRGIVILGHGFSKKDRKCPPSELCKAERMRKSFRDDPATHTHREER